MTTPADDPSPSARAFDDQPPHAGSGGPLRSSRVELSAAQAVAELCPYLTAASGSWRSAAPHREHRCGAVDPPDLLPIEKQRRLCLSTHHLSCPAFRAARAGRAAVLAPGLDPTAVAVVDAARRPLARTSAIVLQQPRFSAPLARWPLDRALSQVALVGLLVIAFAVIAVARLTSSDLGGAIDSPSPSPTASPTATPTPTRRPTPTPSPSGSAVPSGGSPSVAPSFRATYTVQAGDTLFEIAAEFDTTVAAIQEANGLTGSDLRVGQVLNIP